LGEKFDPHKHQSINMVESDAETQYGGRVLQKGYSLNDRILRPAAGQHRKTQGFRLIFGPRAQTFEDKGISTFEQGTVMAKIIGIDLAPRTPVSPSWKTASQGHRKRGRRPHDASIVAYMDDGEVLVAHQPNARRSPIRRTPCFAVKRLIGRRFTEKEVQKDIDLMPYKIVQNSNGDAWTKVRGKKIAPAEVSAQVLIKMKKTAEDYLGEPVTEG